MSKFKAGDKVQVNFEVTVVDADPGNQFWVDREDGGSSLLMDEWAEKILPVLPDKTGSVIRVTRWASHEEDWTALLRAGGWAFSVDRDLHYTAADLERRIKSGSFDFEVLFDAAKGAGK